MIAANNATLLSQIGALINPPAAAPAPAPAAPAAPVTATPGDSSVPPAF